MKNFRLLTVAALMLLSASVYSCKDDDGDSDSQNTIVNTAITPRNAADTAISVSYGSSFKNFRFYSTEDWTVEIPADATWITSDVSSGEAKTDSFIKVRFNFEENTEQKSRSAVVAIVTSTSRFQITITQEDAPRIMTENEVTALGIDLDRVYYPNTGKKEDLLKTGNEFTFARCKVLGNVAVFWNDAYGDFDPNSDSVDKSIRVDVDDMLQKVNNYYHYYVDTLKMVTVGQGKSGLDKYYMTFYLYGTTTWRAEGGGGSEMGCAWVSATSCQPTGSTIAHEMGHCFQYQALADGAGTDGGACWEDNANWMSYSQYAEQAFNSANFTVFANYYTKHFLSTDHMYASYWFQYEWTDKYGKEAFGKVWNNTKTAGGDLVQSYMYTYCNNDISILNKDLWEYAAKCATWDFSTYVITYNENEPTVKSSGSVRDYGKNYIGNLAWKTSGEKDGYFPVVDELAPEATGFNVVRIEVPQGTDRTVKVKLVGTPSASTKNYAGWTVGFVALKGDYTRVYSESTLISSEGEVSFDVPEGTEKLWYIVAATPNKYYGSGTTWPYKLAFSNTGIYPSIVIDADAQMQNTTIVKDVEMSIADGYTGPIVTLSDADIKQIGQAFVMQPYIIAGKMAASVSDNESAEIKFGSLKADGTVDYSTSTNALGQWFDKDGIKTTWGGGQTVFSDFTAGSWSFQLGCYAGAVSVGQKVTFKQCLVYQGYIATIQFNVTFTE